MPSVALGLRLGDGMLRDGVPEPVEPVPRCAAAAEASKTITKANRVLNRTDLSTMAASTLITRNVTPIELQRGKNLKKRGGNENVEEPSSPGQGIYSWSLTPAWQVESNRQRL